MTANATDLDFAGAICSNEGAGRIRLISGRLPEIDEIRAEQRVSLWNFKAWGQGGWSCTSIVVAGASISRRRHRQIVHAMIAWRQARRSPPRCLSCGANDYEVVRFDEADNGTVLHPKCGGTIRLELSALWTGVVSGYPAYTPEGVRDGVYRFANDELQHFASDEVFVRVTGAELP